MNYIINHFDFCVPFLEKLRLECNKR